MGDVSTFSFCQDKIMTTGGEGGLLTTNNPELWAHAWAFKDHGKSYNAVYSQQHASGFRWLHESFGTNWRLTEMQSAIGRVLLRKLPQMVEKRRRLAVILNTGSTRFQPCGSRFRQRRPTTLITNSMFSFELSACETAGTVSASSMPSMQRGFHVL